MSFIRSEDKNLVTASYSLSCFISNDCSYSTICVHKCLIIAKKLRVISVQAYCNKRFRPGPSIFSIAPCVKYGADITITFSDPTSDIVRQYDFPLRCRKTSDTVFVAFVRPLPEPVRRFSSCSTDFSQQIAQVVLLLYLHFFLF
jgi:hypothetical protein